jgi:16S rRNA pseudouridine516 synthase
VAGKKLRLERLLANLGYGSRKEVHKAIKSGAFKFNGEFVVDASAQFAPEDLKSATFDDEKIDPVSPLTLMLHKPQGYTCSSDEAGLLVYDLLPPRWKQRDPLLSSAGRLDKDSTGLVLMTDDGQLLHKIISPKVHVKKQYRVTLRDDLKGDETALFASGEFLLKSDDKPLKPAEWHPDSARRGTMVLQEGRYHQIRRMFGAIGNHVEALHRFQIGGLALDGIEEGQYKVLEKTDLNKIFQ